MNNIILSIGILIGMGVFLSGCDKVSNDGNTTVNTEVMVADSITNIDNAENVTINQGK